MPARDLRLPKRKDEASTFEWIPELEGYASPLAPWGDGNDETGIVPR
jgi:hypothetical protein